MNKSTNKARNYLLRLQLLRALIYSNQWNASKNAWNLYLLLAEANDNTYLFALVIQIILPLFPTRSAFSMSMVRASCWYSVILQSASTAATSPWSMLQHSGSARGLGGPTAAKAAINWIKKWLQVTCEASVKELSYEKSYYYNLFYMLLHTDRRKANKAIEDLYTLPDFGKALSSSYPMQLISYVLTSLYSTVPYLIGKYIAICIYIAIYNCKLHPIPIRNPYFINCNSL